ncbi:MAG: hypothetical protein D6737_08765, partial [Chloroflexi bacterium]
QQYLEIQAKVITLLNKQADFLSVYTRESTRAVGDAIKTIIKENFQSILGDICSDYSDKFARRAMADLAFTDTNDYYYMVDVKTHRHGTAFNMPNLTSVQRLARFYEDDNNNFVILLVRYSLDNARINVDEVYFVPIEFLSWECLTVGALGWGQIQISDARHLDIRTGYPRKKWMLEFCDVMLSFYPKEIDKIGERLAFFEEVKKQWSAKSDSGN